MAPPDEEDSTTSTPTGVDAGVGSKAPAGHKRRSNSLPWAAGGAEVDGSDW